MRTLFLTLLTYACVSQIHAQTPGSNIFDDSFLHEIRFENADTLDWITTKNYQMLKMFVDGNLVDSVGFKRKGNISKYVSTNKYGIKIKTNKYVTGKKYDKIKEFTLHMNFQDPTMLREKMTYDICNEMGLFSLRTAFTKVYINNVYWGLYTIVEGKDEMYKHKFGNRSSDAVESLDFGDMCYIGNNIADYDANSPGNTMPRYEFSNGDTLTAWPNFINMLDKANNTPNGQYLDTVSNYLNLKDFFKYQAVNVYVMNFDSYIGYKGNQIYVFDSLIKKWEVTPWDFNASFGLWPPSSTIPSTYPMIPSTISNGCIASKLNSIPQLKNYYLDAMCELNNTVCDTNLIFAKIDHWKNQIQQAVYDDYRKVASDADFDNGTGYGYHSAHGLTNVPALKTLLSERYSLIKQALITEGYTCTVGLPGSTDIVNKVKMYPNPVKELLTIELNIKKATPVDVYVTDVFGSIVYQINSSTVNDGIKKITWNTGKISNGIYFLNIKTANSLQLKKVIVNK